MVNWRGLACAARPRAILVGAPRRSSPYGELTLLQVLLDAFRFAHQERDMVLGVFHELVEDFHFALEILNEFVMLLIAPGVAERDHLAVDAGDLRLQFLVESLEILSKAA
jgi:hypothetical protein